MRGFGGGSPQEEQKIMLLGNITFSRVPQDSGGEVEQRMFFSSRMNELSVAKRVAREENKLRVSPEREDRLSSFIPGRSRSPGKHQPCVSSGPPICKRARA